jgi:DNA-directed RNA polymerase specialized sigma24 family protein
MPTAEEFDEFYVSTRRELVLQTFALTGDLGASRAAVRDAYVAARHHWDKVGRSEDPLGWVRPRAWSRAQRRHTARPWHRERRIDENQQATLEALHKLPDAQRRTLVLTHLTELPIDAIAREIGVPLAKLDELFAQATVTVVEALECTPDDLPSRLTALEPVSDSVKLPRPTIVRRNGLRRRRNFAQVGSVLIAALMVGAGSFVAVGSAENPAAGSQVTRVMSKQVTKVGTLLLTGAQITALAPGQTWKLTATSRNLTGRGLNTTCQQRRFADEDGAGTWVRRFTTTAGSLRELVQTVEISHSSEDAKKAYATTLGWYAGCTVARIQLVDAYKIGGVGEEAQVLRLRIPGNDEASFVVGVARSGMLTASTVLQTSTSDLVSPRLISAALAGSVKNLCGSKFAGTCTSAVTTTSTTPPPSGETRGMLATADLPAIASVNAPWAGTQPVTASPNRAATTCDKADFAASGAANPISRVFLIPKGNVPERFGITETIGRFPSSRAALKFVNQVTQRMKSCPDKELSSTISTEVINKGTAKVPPYAYFRLLNQISTNREVVAFWTGVTRVGPYVAQITMTPVKKYDVSGKTFAQLLLRGRDRLLEVQ